MIWLSLYLGGWALTTTYLLAKRPDMSNITVVPQWVMTAILAALFVALGSIWPLFLLGRLAFAVWHVLGHPGQGAFVARYAAFARSKQHPLDRCLHEGKMDVGDKYEWCAGCGALREKPHDWVPPLKDALKGDEP